MLDERLKPKKKIREYDKLSIVRPTMEKIPIGKAINYSNAGHISLFLLILMLPFLLKLIGINLFMFQRPVPKNKDIEFVLVNQPEQEPVNKKTPLRADRNTRAGGKHDPSRPIAPPQTVLPKSQGGTPSQAQKKQSAQPQQVQKEQIRQQEQPKQIQKQIAPRPVAPKPMAKPAIPYTKNPQAMKIPIPAAKGLPNISQNTSGPVTKAPSAYSGAKGASQGAPRPMMASGGSQGTRGQGRGVPSPGSSGSMGNPGPGNPNGAPGVDAVREPNFGPYMSDLQRRIKSNWDPPRGDESKRVVLLFKIAKDGRLLSVRVIKSSGSPGADKAALAAVRLTAPFRPLPKEFRGSDVDIQFTFDYNVFGARNFR